MSTKAETLADQIIKAHEYGGLTCRDDSHRILGRLAGSLAMIVGAARKGVLFGDDLTAEIERIALK